MFQRNHVWKAPTSTFLFFFFFGSLQKFKEYSRLCLAKWASPAYDTVDPRNAGHMAKTSTFHRSLELPGLVQPVSRSKGQKCARLSAPSLCATVLVCFKGTMYGKPQPVPFTRALNCQDWSNQFRDPWVKSVLDYPPPRSAPLFWYVSKEPCMFGAPSEEGLGAGAKRNSMPHKTPCAWYVGC